ncbi:MAG: polysaccharide deacetylase family protein [Chitinophagaceae bacterium]|nr:polysaccharide deacetylase family protein [Chitinophagaceae bacterium]
MLPILCLTLYSGCDMGTVPSIKVETQVANTITNTAAPEVSTHTMADASIIIARPEVPILCYHQLRDWRSSDSKTARDYIVPVNDFINQVKSLADSGYNTILPDQLYEYLAYGKALPSKPVMITFDDTRIDQYTVALPELKKHGFKGVFFVMTVSLGKPGYMSKEQVRQLADEGHTVGSHTYDHKNVKTYAGNDWEEQVAKPSRQLQAITGRPVEYFAYPFGLWNKQAIPELKKHGFKSVFQLAASRDENDPLYSVRRIIVPGTWSGNTMQRVMKNSFH